MNKKVLVILITIVLIISIVVIGVVFINRSQKGGQSANNEQIKDKKTLQLYNKILEAKVMTFTKTLDDNNKILNYIIEKAFFYFSKLTIFSLFSSNTLVFFTIL